MERDMANDLLSLFQSFRTTLCVCPHCNEIQRVSDMQLRYEGRLQRRGSTLMRQN